MNIKAALFTVVLCIGLSGIAIAQTVLKKGDSVPNFTEIDVDGNSVNLEDYKGKIVLLNFTATWCGPCWATYTPMNELQKRYADDLVIISFHMDKTPEKWKKKAAKKGIDFDVISIWQTDTVKEVFDWFSPKLYPNFVLLNQEGSITRKWEGNSEKFLNRYVHQAMRRANK